MEGGWSVYILRCGDGSLYTGATNDVDRRVAKHASGKGAAYTRSRLPVRLVFHEKAADRGAALSREAQIKKLPRREKLRLLADEPAEQAAQRPASSSRGRGKSRRSAGRRPRPPPRR